MKGQCAIGMYVFRISYRDSLQAVRVPGDGVLVLATRIMGFFDSVLSRVW